MRTRLAPAALQDVEEALAFLWSRSPSAAAGFADRFRRLRQLLGAHPSGGRRTDQENLRCINLRPYSYLIFYEVIDGEVVIQRLLHGARDPRAMPARLR
jgi:toxin ParE1/3/4